jgi:hypothetical protein
VIVVVVVSDGAPRSNDGAVGVAIAVVAGAFAGVVFVVVVTNRWLVPRTGYRAIAAGNRPGV